MPRLSVSELNTDVSIFRMSMHGATSAEKLVCGSRAEFERTSFKEHPARSVRFPFCWCRHFLGILFKQKYEPCRHIGLSAKLFQSLQRQFSVFSVTGKTKIGLAGFPQEGVKKKTTRFVWASFREIKQIFQGSLFIYFQSFALYVQPLCIPNRTMRTGGGGVYTHRGLKNTYWGEMGDNSHQLKQQLKTEKALVVQ